MFAISGGLVSNIEAFGSLKFFWRCCINDVQPLKNVVSCPYIFGTLRRIPIWGISRPVSLYPHSSASALSCAFMRIVRILDSIVVWCPEFSMWCITTIVTVLKDYIFFGHDFTSPIIPHDETTQFTSSSVSILSVYTANAKCTSGSCSYSPSPPLLLYPLHGFFILKDVFPTETLMRSPISLW